MTDALVEKVKAAIDDVEAVQNDFGDWHDDMDGMARAAIRAVLEWYSDERNAPTHNKSRDWPWQFASDFAVAMQDELERIKRAARDEVSRG